MLKAERILPTNPLRTIDDLADFEIGRRIVEALEKLPPERRRHDGATLVALALRDARTVGATTARGATQCAR